MSTLPNISPELIKAYQDEIAKSSSESTAKRKSISLNRFFDWAASEGKIAENPMAANKQALVNKQLSETTNTTKQIKTSKIGKRVWATIATTSALVILLFLLTFKLKFPIPFTLNFAQENTNPTVPPQFQTQTNQQTPITATSAGNGAWNLYAQLKLTDAKGAPQVGSETVSFKLYNSDKNGTPVYTSEPQTITTDANGSTLISLDGVPSDLFLQNDKLYLEPQIGSASGSMRIPVSTANVAANLGGFFPANPNVGAGPETVPVIDSTGALNLASQSPAVIAKQGNLLVQGQAVTIKTADGSDGNIEINPDGKGYAHFLFEGSKGNFLNAQGPNLNSGSLYYGMVPNNATGYNLIELQSGAPKMTTKFAVDAKGNTYAAGNLNIAGNIATAGTDRLTSTGALENITGYSQNSGNFVINQNPGDYASITKNSTALSDVLNLTLNENMIPGSHYSSLVLNRLGGDDNARALLVNSGNSQFNGQVELGRFTSNPDVPIGTGSLVYNSTDNNVYFWNGTTWISMGGSGSGTAFDAITSGTNTTATMIVGSGASLNYTGTGTINASTLNSLASTSFLRSDTSSNLTSGTLTTNAGTTLAVNGDLTVADPNVTFTGASTTFTTTGDLNLNIGGGNLTLANNQTINIGGNGSHVAYNVIADSIAGAGPGMTSDRDLYVQGNLQVGGSINGLSITPGGFTTGSVTFIGPSGNLSEDNANFFWDNTAKKLILGGDLAVNGGNLTTTQTTANLFTNASTLGIGAATGTATINNATTDVKGNLTIDGATGITSNGNGAGVQFNGTGNHNIQATAGTLRIGAATLTGTLTGNAQNITNVGTQDFGTGNVQISGTNIGLTTDTNLLALSTNLLTVNGGLTTTGDANVNGNTTLGTTTANTVTFNGRVNSSIVPSANDTYNLGSASPALEWNNVYAKTFVQNGQLVCDAAGNNCPTGAGIWAQNLGAIYPINNTVDLLIGASAGATATQSAKFAFTGVNTGLPTASIAGDIANVATYLTGDGNLATTNAHDLTLGSVSTGNVILNSRGVTSLTANGANLTAAGTVTLPNSNTLTGVANYLQNSQGYSVGGGTTFHFDASGNIVANDVAVNSGNLTSTAATDNIFAAAGNTLINIGPTGAVGSVALSGGSANTGCTLDGTNGNFTCSGNITSTSTTGTQGFWTQALGALYPTNNTVDLLVGASSTTSAKFAFTGVNSGVPTASIAGTAGSFVATYLTGNGNLATTNMAPLTIGGATTGSVQLNPKGSTGLFVDGAGNVGVGTTAPANQFQVTRTVAADDLVALFQNTNSGGFANVKIDRSGTNRAARLEFSTGGNADWFTGVMYNGGNPNSAYSIGSSGSALSNAILTILTTGQVGIGTTTPAFKLDVAGGGIKVYGVNTSVSGAGLELGWDGTQSRIFSADRTSGYVTQPLTFDASRYEFRTGNVGIGTATPLATLDVAGTASVSGSLTFRAGTGTIQTTTFSPLVLGGSTTGNITLNPSNGIAGGNVSPAVTNVTDLGTSSSLEFRNVYAQAFTQNGFGVCDANGTNCPAGAGFWGQTLGALYPNNNTVDLLIGASAGATATQSAKFAFTGVNTGGTPTASIAGTAGSFVATYLTGNGNLAVTNMADLTLGGVTTSHVIASSPFSAGSITDTGLTASRTVFTDANKTLTTTGTVAANQGGTGQSSYTVGDILYADTTSTLAKLADAATGNVLLSGGVGVAPSYGKVVLGTQTTGNYVSSIIGTANQITASSPTGDVTLSIPTDFRAPGTVNAVNGIYTGTTAGTQRIDASGNLTNIGTTQLNGVTYTWPGTATSNYILQSLGSGASSTLAWVDPASVTASTQYWDQTSGGPGGGVLYPKNNTVDLLIGASSTASAKFAFTNILAGTPTLNVSAQATNIAIKDNTTSALQILEGTTNPYLAINTNNGAENMAFGNATTNPSYTFLGSGLTTLGGNLAVNGATSADITTTTNAATLFNTNAATLNIGGAATTMAIGIPGASGSMNLMGGSGNTGCTLNGVNGNFTCTGNITTTATSGTQGWWQLNGTDLSPTSATYNLAVGGTTSSSPFYVLASTGDLTTAGNAAINGGSLTTTASTATLFNTNAATLSIGGASTTALNIGNGNTAYTAINLGSGTGGNTIGIGNGINTSAQTVNIANGAAAGDSTVNILSGNSTSGTQTLNLGNGNRATAINLGNGTGADTINISTNATGADTIVIGNNNAATTLALTGGTAWSVSTAGLITTASNIAVNGGSLTTTNATANIFTANAATINLGINGSGVINTGGGSAANGCTFNDANGNLTCAGNITSTSTSGSQGFWGQTSGGTTGGVLYPLNNTVDLLIGASSTASAKFAFTNILTGTPTLNVSAQATNIAVKDNTANTLQILEGLNPYLALNTTNNAENVAFGNSTTNPTYSFLGSGATTFGGTLGPEVLTNGALTGGTSWSVANGFTLASNQAQYTHNASGGTLTQTTANFATPVKANRRYRLIYTISGATGSISANVTTSFANAATSLTLTNGINTTNLISAASPSDFVIAVTSSAGGAFNIDDLTLKEADGDVALDGVLNVGNTSFTTYSRFATSSGTVTSHNLGSAQDVLIGGNTELNGTLYLDSGIIADSRGVSTILFPSNPTLVDSPNVLDDGSWWVNNAVNPGIAALMINQGQGGDILSASASGVAKMTLTNAGNLGVGTTVPNSRIEAADTTSLATESLTNGALTSGTSWTRTGDMALTSNAATYTHSTGAGTLSQAAVTLSIAGKANRLYAFTYTISGVSGTAPVATITTSFAASAQTLTTSTNGTYTTYFHAATSPGAFTINVTSSTTGSFTIDTLSLKEVTGGNIAADGLFTGGGTAGIKVDGSGNVGIGTTAPISLLSVGGAGVGGAGTYSLGTNYGVYGESNSSTGYGVYGINTNIGTFTTGAGGYFSSITGYSLLTGFGNAGIGTNAPTFQLQVNGNIGGNNAPANVATTQVITTVDNSPDSSAGYSIAIGTDGLPVIAYGSTTPANNKFVVVTKCGTSDCSTNNTTTTIDINNRTSGTLGSNQSGNGFAMAIGADGMPVIAYGSNTPSDNRMLYVSKCTKSNCTQSGFTQVNGSAESSDGFAIAIGTDGLPVIAYGSHTPGDAQQLVVTHCGNAACSSGNTTTTVDSSAKNSSGFAINIGIDGFPVIAYNTLTDGNVKVAKCANVSCSSGTTLTTIETPGNTSPPGMAIGKNGFPIIAYQGNPGGTTQQLRVAACGNSACSSGNVFTNLDTATTADSHAMSVAVGSDGLPVISYAPANSGVGLKVAKCTTSTCTAATLTTIETGAVENGTSLAIGTDGTPVIAYGNSTGSIFARVVKCANSGCSSTTGTALAGGFQLGGWMANSGSYSVPYQSVNTFQISNPSTFQNLDFLTAGSTKMSILPNGNVGIGTTTPAALLAVGASLPGAAMSTTFLTNAGALGTAINNELAMGSIGATTGNDIALGVRAYREAAGSSWTTAGIQLSYDVDNTPRAAGAFIELSNSGNIGINTPTPQATLDVNGSVSFNGVNTSRADTAATVNVTVSTKGNVYWLNETTGTNQAVNVTCNFNVTGVAEQDGSFAYIYVRAGKGTSTVAHSTTTNVSINGTSVATETTGVTTGSIAVNGATVFVRMNTAWRPFTTTNSPLPLPVSDLAEWMPFAGNTPLPGQLLSIDTSGKVINATNNGGALAGIVTTKPFETMGQESPDSTRVALSGRVPAIVSTAGGNINSGDAITASDIPGVGKKLNFGGFSVGKALDTTSNWTAQSCPAVSSVDDIIWPDDQGMNENKPCFTLPDGTRIGKIMALLGVSWEEPQTALTDEGNLNIAQVQDTNGNPTGKYALSMDLGNGIKETSTRIASFADIIAANIKTGAITTTDFVAENVKAGSVIATNFTTNGFNAFQGTVDHLLITTGLVTPNINVALISPLPNTSDVTVKIGSDATPSGQFNIQNTDGQNVASIDNEGNATFSGTVHAQNIDAIQQLLTSVSTDQATLSQLIGSGNFSATNSANLSQIATQDLYVTNQAAINSLSLAQSLTLGSDFTIDASGINSLTTPLKLESLAAQPIELMAGLVTIDTHGNVNIAGDLNVAGRIQSSGLTLKDSVQTATTSAALLSLQNLNGDTVSSVNASGSAEFNSLTTPQIVIAGASDATESAVIANGVITTNSTIGKVTLPAGTSEVTINNPKVTDYTLVYVTPTSSTQNNVLYVKSKQNGSFVVGFDNPINTDVNFNWWIVQVQN